MTEFYLDGPPVHRLRYLLDYCQAKRIAPNLLTRGLANDEALAEPLATLALDRLSARGRQLSADPA